MNDQWEQNSVYYDPQKTRFIPSSHPKATPLPRVQRDFRTGLNPQFSSGFVVGMLFAWFNFLFFEWVIDVFYSL